MRVATEPIAGRLVTSLVLPVAAVALLAVPAAAELVILEGGQVLKVDAYRVEGDRAVVELPSGGWLELPLLRIDRVVDDEVTDEPAPPAPIAFELGFLGDRPVPETPYGALIHEAARRYSVNADLVAAMVRAESAFDPAAVSSKGAVGLLQLMPATARRFGLTASERYRPALNLEAGVRYLRWLIDRYGEDLPRVLAGYNAGEGTVDRYNGVPPFRETRDYIRRIYRFLGMDSEATLPAGR